MRGDGEKKKGLAGLTRRDVLRLGGVGMAAVTLGGLPGTGFAAERKPKYGGRLRVGERHGSTGLDAHKNQFLIDFFNFSLIYNALIAIGPLPDMKMSPDLARTWEISKDGREYLFNLRDGVRFHHGKELDSGDVKYSIERVMNPAVRSPRASAFNWIDSVTAPDKRRVKIRLKEPYGPFLTTLTIQNCPIIPAGVEPTGVKPAPGTGPFVFKSIVPNETAEFARFGQYWETDDKTGDRLPYLDSIFVKKIVDETVRWTALRAGDLDYISLPPPNVVVQEMKKPTPGIVTVVPKPLGCTWLFFNVTKPPFDNKKVRQAMAHVIDKKEIIKAAYWGLGEEINNQFFTNDSVWYVPVKDRDLDVARAKQLLAEAGYPNGFKTEFFQFHYSQSLDACNAMIGQLKKIGIEGTIKVIDRAPYFTGMRKGEFGLSVFVESVKFDPDDAYYTFLHSGEIDKNNWSRYANKEFDRLVENARSAWRTEERAALYRKAVEIIREDLPIFYIARVNPSLAYKDYVKGFGAGLGTWFNYATGGFKKTWLDK